eukprot:763388-Hanusia_phi.AAC.3
MEGGTMALRDLPNNMLLPNGDPGHNLGGTMTANSTMPTVHDYEAFFGPAARNIKFDNQRHKRHQRYHLPDVLKGPNDFLTDRVDGLITDATNSPFTRNILPYVYMANPDAKFKWQVYSFDEGLATRVPYESAARVLTQTKRSQAGYIIRQGLAIQMEHNFMMSEAGRVNFQRQLQQLVGSIQLTNDLDVHMALLRAPSYEREQREKYSSSDKTTTQLIRQYVDMYGIMQKNPNALDIIIEDTKRTLKKWGSPDPSFLMCNGALTMQLTMNVEKTQYVTQGTDGLRMLKSGPDLPSYRGLNIIHSRQFSMQNGEAPRDILRRRSRVAEHYRINGTIGELKNKRFKLYDQQRDSMFTLTLKDILKMSNLMVRVRRNNGNPDIPGYNDANAETWAATGGLNQGDPDFQHASASNTLHVPNAAGVIQNPNNFVYPPQREFRVPANVVYDNIESLKACPEFSNSYDSLQSSQNMGLLNISKHSMAKSMDTLLASSSGFETIRPVHTLARDVTSMNVNHSGLIQWTANAFRDTRSKIKAPDNLIDAAAREIVALKIKKVSMQGDERIKIHIANIPVKEIEAAVAEGIKKPYTVTEVNAAISILGSVIMNAVRAPNALNPKAPADIETNAHSFVQFAMSRALYNTRLCNALLQPLDVPIDLQLEFASALDIDADRSDIVGNTGMENPLSSTVMVKYMSLYHPDPATKQRCNGILGSSTKSLDETALHFMNEVMSYVETSAKEMKTLSMEVPLLTSMLNNVVNSKVQTSGTHSVFTTATGCMYLDDDKRTLHSKPMFSNKADEALRSVLTQNGIKLEDDTILGTEFRCYPFPVSNVVNLEDINSVINNSNINEYTLATPLNALQVNKSLSMFTNSSECRNSTLTHFYRNALCRLFTSVVSYANDNKGYFAIPAAKEITGTVRHVNSFRNVSSPLISTFGIVMPVVRNAQGENHITFRNQRDLTEDQYIDLMLADEATADTVAAYNIYFRNKPGFQRAQLQANVNMRNHFLDCYLDAVIVRPNIEHNMLAIIMGRGGNPELGATYWGQTELSCYDDSQHGLWGMSYKYHESAIVHNEKNLVRVWDVCFDGYNGGMDSSYLNYNNADDVRKFAQDTSSIDRPYEGKSMFVMSFLSHPTDPELEPKKQPWPNPIVFYDPNIDNMGIDRLCIDPDNIYNVIKDEMRVFRNYENEYLRYVRTLPDFRNLHVMRKVAGQQSIENETNQCALSFHGQLEIIDQNGIKEEIQGTGHLGPSYPGVASIREGKGYRPIGMPQLQRMV